MAASWLAPLARPAWMESGMKNEMKIGVERSNNRFYCCENG